MTLSRFAAYLASLLFGLVASAFALFMLVDRLAIPDHFLSYQETLLDQVPSPRIIVDSGSNSRHNIAPEMLEAAFGQTTIVVADNINVPLDMKIHRLERYAREGDTVILPLEWQSYFSKAYSSYFIYTVIRDNEIYDFSGYYHALDLLDRLSFSLQHLNISYLRKGLTNRFTESRLTSLRRRSQLLIHDMTAGIHGDVKMDGLRARETGPKTCHDFVGPGTAAISTVVPWAADRLAELQRTRKIKVILTWPALAGDNCYDFASEVDPLVAKIKAIFTDAGVPVVSDPRRSLFSDAHVLNSYYHIDSAAARERSGRLIEDIQAAGLAPAPADARHPDKFSLPDFAREKTRLMQERLVGEALIPLSTGIYKPGSDSFERHFHLPAEGWHERESWGVWSRGASSKIVFRPSSEACVLSLDVHYFQGGKPSLVALNGGVEEELGRGIEAPSSGGLSKIELRHRDVASPKALGLSGDDRSIRLGLHAIAVECGPPSRAR